MPVRWGVSLPLAGIPLRDHRPWIERVEALGFDDVWSVEGGAADAFTPLALATVWAPRLRVGTGVVSSFTRGPGVLAQTAAALADAAAGRFVLGIGSSSKVIVSQWNAAEFERPYQRTLDMVRFLRAAFRGERVTEEYETFAVRGFRLPCPPEKPLPVVVAALRERMLRMAAREADGVMLNWLSAEDVTRMSAIVREENPHAEVVDRIMVLPTEDTEAVHRAVKPLVASYTAVGVYRAFHEWLGRGDDLGESWAAWEAGDRKAAAHHVPDSVVDELCVHGSAAVCRDHLDRYIEAGVTTPVLALLSPPERLAVALESLAPRQSRQV